MFDGFFASVGIQRPGWKTVTSRRGNDSEERVKGDGAVSFGGYVAKRVGRRRMGLF